MFYDPMISKLIVHAPDRPRALVAMNNALQDYQVGDGFVLIFPTLVGAYDCTPISTQILRPSQFKYRCPASV